MNKEIKFTAPDIPCKEACTALGHYLEWREEHKGKKAIFNRYGFETRAYDDLLVIKITRKN